MHEPPVRSPTLIAGVSRRSTRSAGGAARDRGRRLAAARTRTHGARDAAAAAAASSPGRLEPGHSPALLARAEIYLSASLSDSTSVSLLEAMACGAVPVVSDIDGNREWVAEGEGARLFAPGDPGSLARALERALDDPAWRESARAAQPARDRGARRLEREHGTHRGALRARWGRGVRAARRGGLRARPCARVRRG